MHRTKSRLVHLLPKAKISRKNLRGQSLVTGPACPPWGGVGWARLVACWTGGVAGTTCQMAITERSEGLIWEDPTFMPDRLLMSGDFLIELSQPRGQLHPYPLVNPARRNSLQIGRQTLDLDFE